MTADLVLGLARESALLALLVGGPLLAAVLAAGIAVSVIQAVTQVQEMTLTFVPKVLAVVAVIALLGHWMLERLVGFTTRLLLDLPVWAR